MITKADIQRAMLLRRYRLQQETVKEDISWDVLVEAGGATHSIRVQCLSGQTANIDWGDNSSTEATATTLTTYAHDYPAGTFTIVITGGISTFNHGSDNTNRSRTKVIKNINLPGLTNLTGVFGEVQTAVSISAKCRLNGSLPEYSYLFWGNNGLSSIPLSFWPKDGFAYPGNKNFIGAYFSSKAGSIAPSQIFWDSGNAFTFNRMTFYPNNATAWLNYAAAYTDPATGITYSKIPYGWGGAPD